VIAPALAGDFLCEVFRHVLPNLAAHEGRTSAQLTRRCRG
jgi:hypothetical protein